MTAPERFRDSCEWTPDEELGTWDTGCGHTHLFLEAGPTENGYLFCPYCGNGLRTVAGIEQPTIVGLPYRPMIWGDEPTIKLLHHGDGPERTLNERRGSPSARSDVGCTLLLEVIMDWIDEERKRRQRGINRPLLQSQHAEVNARYPGCTLEYCCECGEATGRAGRGEDSLFTDDGEGPYCAECWNNLPSNTTSTS